MLVESSFRSEPIKYPFTEWWGYSNLVYNHNIEEPVSFSFNFVIGGYKIFYEYNIIDNNGLPNFITVSVKTNDSSRWMKANEGFYNVNITT